MVSGLLLFCPHGRGSWVSNTFLTPARQQGGHFIGNGLLARYIQVAVDVGRHLDITVAQPLLHVLEGEAVTQQETGAAMPLRYNNDKPEKPRNFKGLEVYQADFSSFSNPKNQAAKPLFRRGC